MCLHSLLARMTDIHVNVYLCNVVRTVIEGKALVSPILDTLKTADSYILTFLVDVSLIIYATSIGQVVSR